MFNLNLTTFNRFHLLISGDGPKITGIFKFAFILRIWSIVALIPSGINQRVCPFRATVETWRSGYVASAEGNPTNVRVVAQVNVLWRF